MNDEIVIRQGYQTTSLKIILKTATLHKSHVGVQFTITTRSVEGEYEKDVERHLAKEEAFVVCGTKCLSAEPNG